MITNICFHGIGVAIREREPGEARYWVSTEVFRRILDEIVGRTDVRISFDDGNRSDVDVALPALQERGLSATFFALAGRLSDPASLSAADLRDLRRDGMSIGTHGWAHIPWRGLSDEDARREFVEARVALAEAAGAEIVDAAMPLGRYDRRTLSGLRVADYRTVFSSDRFPARPDAWFQARYSVMASDTVESIRPALARRISVGEVRNITASLVKRLR